MNHIVKFMLFKNFVDKIFITCIARRFLGNLEYRPIFKTHPLYILAGALFCEGGTVWTPPRTSPALHTAVGLGCRVGLPQVYDTPVLRADLAWALSDRTLQLSFGVGQFF